MLRIKKYLEDYPEAYAEKVALVSFTDPCLTPEDLIGTNNRDVVGGANGYAWDGSIISWDQTPALQS